MKQNPNDLLQGIDTVIVRVSNIAAAKGWYQTQLGFASIWEDAAAGLVVLQVNGVTSLTLWQTNEKINNSKATAVYPIFKTPDAVALKELLQSNGVVTDALMEDAHVKYFQFFDPDGNVLEACQVLEL